LKESTAFSYVKHIVAYLLKPGIVEPEKTTIARQPLCKHATIPAPPLHNLNSASIKIRMIKSRRMRWTGHVARMGEKGDAYRILVGKPEGKRPLGRPRRM
jgi:hypothetical protein